MGQEYDSPWKEALDRFFPDFLSLLFPNIHRFIDWSRGYETCSAELAKLAPDSEVGKREADTLVKVTGLDGQPTWVLIHVEVQNQQDPLFTERMMVYHYRILDRYRVPLCSLAVLGDTGLDWRPSRHRNEMWGCRLVLEFPMVKLEDHRHRIRALETSTNPFGPIVAAHLHTRTTGPDEDGRRLIKFRMLRQLLESGLEPEEIQGLLRLVDWLLSLSKRQAGLFRRQIENYKKETGMSYITTFEHWGREEGLKEGRREGRAEGLRDSILSILCDRFPGTAASEVMARLRGLDREQLQRLVVAAARVSSLEEFEALL